MVTITYAVVRWKSNGKLKVTSGHFQMKADATWDEVAQHLENLMLKQYSKFTLMSWSSNKTLQG